MRMSFRLWLEAEQPAKTASYYFELLGLPPAVIRRPDAYEQLDQAYKKLLAAGHPEAKDAYIRAHAYLDKQRGGKHFDAFFADVTRGKADYMPQAEYQPDFDMSEHEPYMQVRAQYHGNFDHHIKTSIPTFGDLQDKKGHAIVRAFGDQEIHMLDIGGSEGSFARTISHMTGGKVQTDIVDPNEAMAAFYHSKGKTPGSNYIQAAFQRGWINDDGTRMPELNSQTTEKRYDIIHEAMVFQFISNQRDGQVAEVKSLLKPGGLFLTEEKLLADKETWDRNEAFKDREHKDKYFTKAALQKKEKVVAFAAEKEKGLAQDPLESEAVGMVNNMVHTDQFEQTLTKFFSVVYQYWDSGNFKGYAASDSQQTVARFLAALGDVNSKFSTTKLPRRVTVEETFVTYREWLKENGSLDNIVLGILPGEDERDALTRREIKEKFAAKILQAAQDLGLELQDDELDEILERIVGIKEWPEFDISHYNYHC